MKFDLPTAFLSRMRRLLPAEDYARFCKSYDAPLRRGVRANTLKISPEKLQTVFSLPLENSVFTADGFYLDAPHKAGADPLFHAGAYYMQEPSAGAVVGVLAPRSGERVLDMCAAPGGKSTQIAAALQGTGLLWSNEYVKSRARILEQNLERCGVKNGVVSSADSAVLAEKLSCFFDAVLVDAPCSGEGMFRKEPAALTDWSEDTVSMCAARQREILDNAAKTVKAGGRLVYSTCTFAPEENECIAAWFLQTHPDFVPLKIEVSFGQSGWDADTVTPFAAGVDFARFDPAACRRILPYHGGEGHFIAAFYKTDGADAPVSAYHYTPFAAGETLYTQLFCNDVYGVPMLIGETVRLLPQGLPALQGCGVLGAGVRLAEQKKNRLEPCHAAFVAAHGTHCRQVANFAADSAEIRRFLHGEELPFEGENGHTAVVVEGLVCGFGKCVNGKIKNHYPKGLRLL